MIQEYLNQQFIKTSEDTNFEKLKKTCVDLAKKINKDKAKILAYSLIAFDPEVPANNKDVVEIKNQIIENWQTFVSNSKDTELTIIRAVILESLEIITTEKIMEGWMVWLAVNNSFKHYKLGLEENMLSKFILNLGNKVQSEVSEEWNFSPDYEMDVPKMTAAIIDENDLATITAATIKEAVGKALKKQIIELRENQKEFANQIALMQMRTQLLWWKEAGYSPSQKVNYKSMKDGQLQLLLAYDYSDFIPEMYPVSVDYFLIETLKSLSTISDKKIKISDFLKMIEQCNSELRNVIPDFASDDGRISFANFIYGLVHRKYQATKFKSLVGVTDSTELTLAEITIWIFHDLHSFKLSISK